MLAMTLAMVKVFPEPVAEEHLCRFAGLHAFRELADGFGLVAHRAVRGGELKSCHNVLLWGERVKWVFKMN